MTLSKVTPNYSQEKAIRKSKLKLDSNDTTWFQDVDKYIYSVVLSDDFVNLYIFSPSGNTFNESRELGGDGWETKGWDNEE